MDLHHTKTFLAVHSGGCTSYRHPFCSNTQWQAYITQTYILPVHNGRPTSY